MNIVSCFCAALLLTLTEAGRRRDKRTDVNFESDTDVKKYLDSRHKSTTIFKCKKVVMVQWLHSVIPYVDLECEVLGDVKSIQWYKNDSLIKTGGSERSISLAQPHYSKRTFFNTWHDYKLRMLHVTEADNGAYKLVISGSKGRPQKRIMMLEVMTDYRDKKWLEWMTKVGDGKDRTTRHKSKRKLRQMRKRELMKEQRRLERATRKLRVRDKDIFDQ